MKHFSPEIKQDPLGINHVQYVRDVVFASVRRRFNVTDVVWMSKRCRVPTGLSYITNMLSSFKCGNFSRKESLEKYYNII